MFFITIFQKTTSGTLPQYNTAQMKPESTQPAVMQPIAEPPPAYSPTAAQPLISAELQRKEEVKIHLLIN